MTQINSISAEQLKELSHNPNLKIFDIREKDEYERDHIIGAQNVPSSILDTYNFKDLKETDIVVFYCELGCETNKCKAKLEKLPLKEVKILEGGLDAWRKIGCTVVKNEMAPLPIMRQVQIMAGGLVVLGVILSYTISPSWILLSGLVGIGLIGSGISGYCGMARLLMKLPYNQNNCKTSCCHKKHSWCCFKNFWCCSKHSSCDDKKSDCHKEK